MNAPVHRSYDASTPLTPVVQQVLFHCGMTYKTLAKELRVSEETLVALAQGRKRLTFKQLQKIDALTDIDYRFWQRREDAYFAQ